MGLQLSLNEQSIQLDPLNRGISMRRLIASRQTDLVQPSTGVRRMTIDHRIATALEKVSQVGFFRLARRDWHRLASEIGLSYSRFHHLFREQMGIPPGHFIKCVRLRQAKWLLEKRSIPIKEVMFSVGFADASHFCRDFKVLTGLSPTSYREQQRRRRSN